MSKLEKFPTLVPTLQTAKIIELLEELRQAGEIGSDAEYNNLLKQKLLETNGDSLVPLYKRIPLRPGLGSSALFNYQMDQIRRDVEVLFLELANIGSVLKAHSEVFKDKYLDQIRFSIKDLNTKIDSLQVVRNSVSGYEDAVYNSFTDLSDLLNRNNPNSDVLYQDVRKLSFITDTELGLVDKITEALILPLSVGTEIPFLSVEVDRTITTETEINIDLMDSDPSNILDSELGTYWYYNVLKREVLPSGAKLVLYFDVGDKKEANYFVIQSVSENPMFVDSIDYIDEYNRRLPLDTDLGDQILDGTKKYVFPTTVLQKIVLTLKQYNLTYLSYNHSMPPLTIDDLKGASGIEPDLSSLNSAIQSSIENPVLLSSLPVSDPPPPNYEVFHQYVFGLDNAYLGKNEFGDNGYFVSKPISLSRVGQIALQTDQSVPTYFDTDLEEDVLAGSIEFEVVKRDYTSKGDLIGVQTLPILPLQTFSVENERLFFSSTRRIIELRFTGHDSLGDGSGVTVFRNGLELIRGIDWTFTDRLDQGDLTDSEITTTTKLTRIEILHSDNAVSTGIYTANYTPRHISDPEEEYYLDSANTILYLPNGNIEFKIDRIFEAPENSDLFLRISLRNTSFSRSLSPKLNNYKLFYSTIS